MATYLKNPNQSHLDFKIDDNTKVICVFDVHRVKIDHAARIKKKLRMMLLVYTIMFFYG